MNIIGVDLSLTRSGVCANGITTTIPTSAQHPSRVEHILDKIESFVAETTEVASPNIWVMEGLAFHSLRLGALAELHGAFKFWLNTVSSYSGELHVCAPATLKLYATGKGNAKKEMLRKALVAILGPEKVAAMKHDEVDAWWLADMGRSHFMQLPNLKSHQQRCLGKVFTRERGATKS